jgi:hypothetical protein
MKDEIAYGPLECLTMKELAMLQRMATRYSEIVREHAYLVGLMNLAMRTGDKKLLATTKGRLAETEFESSQCSTAMRVLGRELMSSVEKDSASELVGVGETCEYATA